MADQRDQTVADHLRRSHALLERVVKDPAFHRTIGGCAAFVHESIRAGGKLMIAGNGGSAADAQHIAAEFVGRYRRDRAPMAAIALTTDTSALTAIGNDYGFADVFSRQLRGLGRPGDVFLGISTSGRSPNIIAALKAAREMNIGTIGFTGASADEFLPLCDRLLAVPSDETALIQQIHITAAHAICGSIETP